MLVVWVFVLFDVGSCVCVFGHLIRFELIIKVSGIGLGFLRVRVMVWVFGFCTSSDSSSESKCEFFLGGGLFGFG